MHSQPESDRKEALDYIQSMLGQLRLMAQAERCDMLTYLIEMAYLEATDAMRQKIPSEVSEPNRNVSS